MILSVEREENIMFDTKVVTSYANGTIINLEADDALNFIIGLSITITPSP